MMFHNTYVGTFRSLAQAEYIIALWQGLAYAGSQSAAAQVGGAVMNEITSKALGYSKYTPQVFAALTSPRPPHRRRGVQRRRTARPLQRGPPMADGRRRHHRTSRSPRPPRPTAVQPLQPRCHPRARRAQRPRRQRLRLLAVSPKPRGHRPDAIHRHRLAHRSPGRRPCLGQRHPASPSASTRPSGITKASNPSGGHINRRHINRRHINRRHINRRLGGAQASDRLFGAQPDKDGQKKRGRMAPPTNRVGCGLVALWPLGLERKQARERARFARAAPRRMFHLCANGSGLPPLLSVFG